MIDFSLATGVRTSSCGTASTIAIVTVAQHTLPSDTPKPVLGLERFQSNREREGREPMQVKAKGATKVGEVKTVSEHVLCHTRGLSRLLIGFIHCSNTANRAIPHCFCLLP